jgi:hypothetical protein
MKVETGSRAARTSNRDVWLFQLLHHYYCFGFCIGLYADESGIHMRYGLLLQVGSFFITIAFLSTMPSWEETLKESHSIDLGGNGTDTGFQAGSEEGRREVGI